MDNGDGTDWKRPVKKTADASNGFIEGSKACHGLTGSNYVLDSSRKIGRNVRPDAESNPENISRMVSKLSKAGGLTAGKGMAIVCAFANNVRIAAIPLVIAIDASRVSAAVDKDENNGTTRNTVETAASVAGGWGGGFAGALGGAAAGTAILPGIGTFLGGIIGCLSGGIGGSLGASAAAEAIGDAVDYDVEERVCDECGKKFKVLKYKGERSQICPECSKHSGR